MKNKNERYKVIKLVIVGCVIVFSIILIHLILGKVFDIGDEYIFSFIQAETNIAAIVGVLGAIITIKETQQSSIEAKNISKGQFVLELHKEFANESYGMNIFMKCWNEYNPPSKEKNDENIVNIKKEILDKDRDNGDIVKYLTFFETLYLMYKNEILLIEDLNDLFGRRFFVVVNNEYIKNNILIEEWKYYKNIYRLYAAWSKKREGDMFSRGKDLLECLDNNKGSDIERKIFLEEIKELKK